MGYDCVDGEIVIVPEQAEVVRNIFDLYLQGLSLGQIKAYGDTMLQKTFTEDFMTGKKSKNNGQRNKYYVKDSYPAIVPAEVFDKVQEEMAKRSWFINKENGTVESSGSKYNGKYILGNLLVCGDCGASYRRRTSQEWS